MSDFLSGGRVGVKVTFNDKLIVKGSLCLSKIALGLEIKKYHRP